jgi:hypothetical protein
MLQEEQTRLYDDQNCCRTSRIGCRMSRIGCRMSRPGSMSTRFSVPDFRKNMDSFPVVKTKETEDEIENMSSPSSSYIDILKDTSCKVNVRL